MKTLNEYMRHRFRFGGQALIHWIETSITKKLLAKAGAPFNRVLDCPCGYGRLTGMLSQAGRQMVSCDVSASRMAAHRHHFRNNLEQRHQYSRCNIMQLPFQDASFDCVVTFRLLHHLVREETRRAVFKETGRVGREYLILSYYGDTALHQLSRRLHRNKEIRNKRKAFLDTSQIIQEAGDAGWRLVESRRVLPLIHAQTVALFQKSKAALYTAAPWIAFFSCNVADCMV